jgi:hypothetical protein
MKQPTKRKLDGIPIRILNEDTGLYEVRVLSDCTKAQRLEWFETLDKIALSSVSEHLSQCLRLIGDHYDLSVVDTPDPVGEIEVVINNCYGGFGLSDKACEALIAKGWPVVEADEVDDYEKTPYSIIQWSPGSNMLIKYAPNYGNQNGFRSHPDVVAVVKALGKAVNSDYSDLKVIKIPDNVEWCITEYDGIEQVEEVHQSWG